MEKEYKQYLDKCRKTNGVAFTRWFDVLKLETGRHNLPKKVHDLYFKNYSIGELLDALPKDGELKLSWKDAHGNLAENTFRSWSELSTFLDKNPSVTIYLSS